MHSNHSIKLCLGNRPSDLIPLVLSFIKLVSLPLRRGEEVFDLGPAGVRVGGDAGDHGIEGAPHRFRDHLVGMAPEIEHPGEYKGQENTRDRSQHSTKMANREA